MSSAFKNLFCCCSKMEAFGVLDDLPNLLMQDKQMFEEFFKHDKEVLDEFFFASRIKDSKPQRLVPLFVETDPNKVNILFWDAARQGDVKTIHYLLKNHMVEDINAVHSWGGFKSNALIDASARGHADIVRFVLSCRP